MLQLIGLTVEKIKGEFGAKGKRIEPAYILFDDKMTYIELEEQDYHTYHDCSSAARYIRINEDAEIWSIINTYPDANTSL